MALRLPTDLAPAGVSTMPNSRPESPRKMLKELVPGPASSPFETTHWNLPGGSALNLTQPSTVSWAIPSIVGASGIATESSMPSKLNACPKRPGANVVPFWSVPLLPPIASSALPSAWYALTMPGIDDGMLKWISSGTPAVTFGVAFASSMACLSEPAPLLLVLTTVKMVGPRFCKLKFTAVAPRAAAETEKLPPVRLAVTGTLACPEASSVAVVPAGNVAPAPLSGALKVTAPPATGSPNALLTATVNGTANGVVTGVSWPSPPATVTVKTRDSTAPMSIVPLTTRLMPRWSVR